MDIYSFLKKDHRKVADLMEQLISTTQDQRQDLFEQIKLELISHSEAEKVTFYQAIRDATRSKQVQDLMEHSDEEHEEVTDYLEKLSNLPIEDEKWLALFGELKHAVQHHVSKEENEIFDKAKEYLDDEQARELVAQMKQLKKEKFAEHAPALAA